MNVILWTQMVTLVALLLWALDARRESVSAEMQPLLVSALALTSAHVLCYYPALRLVLTKEWTAAAYCFVPVGLVQLGDLLCFVSYSLPTLHAESTAVVRRPLTRLRRTCLRLRPRPLLGALASSRAQVRREVVGAGNQQKLLDELYFAFVFQMVTVCIAILLQVPRRYALPRTMRRCGDKRHSDKRRLTT